MTNSERIVVDGLSVVQTSQLLCQVLDRDSLETSELVFVLEVLKYNVGSEERVEWTGALHQPALRGFVLNTRIYINVKRTALIFAALLLDALATRGLSSGLLTMTGHATKSIAYISPKHGAFCNFLTLKASFKGGAEAITPSDVASQTAGYDCLHPKLNCEHRLEGKCAVTVRAVEENFQELGRDNVLTMNVLGHVIKASD